MGLYNFRPCFVPYILDGTKRHTIRAPRRHPDRPGSVMHLYTGLRQPGARLLFRAPCAFVQEFRLYADGSVRLGEMIMSLWLKDVLAWADGFRPPGSSEEKPGAAFDLMHRFWSSNRMIPFEGHVYHWDYDSREGDR